MQIAELTTYIVNLKLRKEIAHASHSRRESVNIIVCCRLKDGTMGFGEGVPREYVTGETPAGAMSQFRRTPWAEQLSGDCTSWHEVFDLCDRIRPAVERDDPRQCGGNSLKCAVELSILDAFGRLCGEPLSAVTHHFREAKPLRVNLPEVRYSGAVTAASRQKEAISAIKMRAFGFKHCKVKVGMNSVDEALRLRRIRRWLGPRMDVRIDANEAWPAERVVAKVEPMLAYQVSCLEQPVPHAEIDALPEVRRRLQVPVMLDESLTGIVDAEAAIRDGTCDMFNIRLSKCGGFINCLRIAAMAHAAGVGYQLGCHPGESGILSAAGRHWASSVRDVRYLEGSYDRHLLKELITKEDITFGYGGVAPALLEPGLGVTVDSAALARMAGETHSARLE